MNEFILFNTTCYKLISTYYNVHYELPYFVQCHVILGVNNNCKLPLRKYVFQVIDKFFLAISFLGSL